MGGFERERAQEERVSYQVIDRVCADGIDEVDEYLQYEYYYQ